MLVIHITITSITLYDVFASGLDVLAQAPPALLAGPAAALGAQLYPSLYRTNDKGTIESQAVFGELYYEPRDDLKLTFGLRYNEDEKTSLSRIAFVNVLGFSKGRATDLGVNLLTEGLFQVLLHSRLLLAVILNKVFVLF